MAEHLEILRRRFDGAEASVIERAKLTPSIGICGTPPMFAGASMPIRSSSVGVRSQAWTN